MDLLGDDEDVEGTCGRHGELTFLPSPFHFSVEGNPSLEADSTFASLVSSVRIDSETITAPIFSHDALETYSEEVQQRDFPQYGLFGRLLETQ